MSANLYNHSFSTPPPGWTEDVDGNWIPGSIGNFNAGNHSFSVAPPASGGEVNPHSFRSPPRGLDHFPGRAYGTWWTQPAPAETVIITEPAPQAPAYQGFGSGMGNLYGTSYRRTFFDDLAETLVYMIIGAIIGAIIWWLIVLIIRGSVMAIRGIGALARRIRSAQIRPLALVSAHPAARTREISTKPTCMFSHAAASGKIHTGAPGSCSKCRRG